MSPRRQHSSRPSYLQASRPRSLHISTSLQLHRASGAPSFHTSLSDICNAHLDLQYSISPCYYASGGALDLHSSTLRHFRACTLAACLQCSTPLFLHVATPTARLHSSMPPRLNACIAPLKLSSLELHASTSARLQCASRILEPHSSIPPCFHVCTPAAQRAFRLPYLQVAMPSTHHT